MPFRPPILGPFLLYSCNVWGIYCFSKSQEKRRKLQQGELAARRTGEVVSVGFILASMVGGDKNHPHLNFHIHEPHIHFHHHGKKEATHIPKGCLAILVGHEGEEQQRFIIPVIYINHPLFMQLLKEAEEEYGFDHKGPLNIPCHVEEFRHVQGIIDKESSHHHHHHVNWCFKA